MKNKKIFIIICLSTILCQIQAQNISGKVVDEKQQAIAYANIVLKNIDSTFVNGGTSDEKGIFDIKIPKTGNYLLTISCIGYDSQIIRLTEIDKKCNLGTFVLTEASKMLDEVNITGNAVVKKIDRQIVYPSEKQLQQSASGYDLLSNLMLPGLKIDPIQKTISTIGNGYVETRINDIKATNSQITSLNPSEVLRVEYIDNPGIRYGDTSVEAVINYIVKRKTSGISGGLEGMNAAVTGFGNDYVYMNVNSGKSEFGVSYFVSYRDYDDRYSDGYDKFNLPDETVHERTLTSVNIPFGYVQQSLEATYNLTEPDKYVFNVMFSDSKYDTDNQDDSQRIIEMGKKDLTYFKHGEDNSNTPSLDIYYSYNLSKKQKFTANLVGTYIGTDYLYDYKEYEVENEPVSHYSYFSKGRKYSLIGEAIYSKEWEKAVLSAGLKGNIAYTKNIYSGDNNQILRMHDNSFYGYAQLQGKFQKLSYMIGAGISQQAFSEKDNSYSFVTFRPSLTLSYPVFKNAQLRYTFSVSPYTPSLSQLSDVIQQKNDMEYNRGNRELKPYRSYNNRLTFSWDTSRLNAQLTGKYTYWDKPIMRTIFPVVNENEHYLIEYAYANADSHYNIGIQLNLSYKLIPDYLTVSGNGGVNRYRSEGEGFSNEYTSWTGGLALSGNYKKISLTAGANTRPKSRYGYYINYDEKYSYIQLNYNNRSFHIGAACLYPFTPSGWTGGSQVTGNPYVEKKNWTHIADNGNMFCFYFSYKFNYGRKHQAGQKTLNNSDNDSGIVK